MAIHLVLSTVCLLIQRIRKSITIIASHARNNNARAVVTTLCLKHKINTCSTATLLQFVHTKAPLVTCSRSSYERLSRGSRREGGLTTIQRISFRYQLWDQREITVFPPSIYSPYQLSCGGITLGSWTMYNSHSVQRHCDVVFKSSQDSRRNAE